MKTSITLTNLLRNDLGKFFLSPPSLGGFCVANILVVSESIEKVLFNSGIKISARWSRHAFKPSKTDWVAKFNSSSKIQYPESGTFLEMDRTLDLDCFHLGANF